jgi:retron-type reverse transcriptase
VRGSVRGDHRTIKDRVAQMAAVIVLEATFEAHLTEEQYTYRAQRSAHDAIRGVHGLLNWGCTEVVDADLSILLANHSIGPSARVGI